MSIRRDLVPLRFFVVGSSLADGFSLGAIGFWFISTIGAGAGTEAGAGAFGVFMHILFFLLLLGDCAEVFDYLLLTNQRPELSFIGIQGRKTVRENLLEILN